MGDVMAWFIRVNVTTIAGFDKYKGGLDTVHDLTGLYSVYTHWRGIEIMFHVSTLLPYEKNDPQKVSFLNWLELGWWLLQIEPVGRVASISCNFTTGWRFIGLQLSITSMDSIAQSKCRQDLSLKSKLK